MFCNDIKIEFSCLIKNNKAMKLKTFLIGLFLIALSVGEVSSQRTMSDFFYDEGAELIAKLAHPTNTFSYARYTVYKEYVHIKIFYEKDYTTELRLYKDRGIFYSISVIEDTDLISPFFFIELTKNIAYSLIREASPDLISQIESVIGKTLADMTGRQLSCVALTIAWWDY